MLRLSRYLRSITVCGIRRCGLVGRAGFGSVDSSGIDSLPLIESSESLLVTALECTPEGEKVTRESTGLTGKAGQIRLLFWHSSGTFPDRHCMDGKQFVISKGGNSVAITAGGWWLAVDTVLLFWQMPMLVRVVGQEYVETGVCKKAPTRKRSVYMFPDRCTHTCRQRVPEKVLRYVPALRSEEA